MTRAEGDHQGEGQGALLPPGDDHDQDPEAEHLQLVGQELVRAVNGASRDEEIQETPWTPPPRLPTGAPSALMPALPPPEPL